MRNSLRSLRCMHLLPGAVGVKSIMDWLDTACFQLTRTDHSYQEVTKSLTLSTLVFFFHYAIQNNCKNVHSIIILFPSLMRFDLYMELFINYLLKGLHTIFFNKALK